MKNHSEQGKKLAEQLDEILTKTDELSQQLISTQQEIALTEQEIAIQGQIVSDSNTRITNLESMKANLDSKLSSLPAEQVDERATINSQKSQIEAQITAEKERRDKAQAQKDKLETEVKPKLDETLNTTTLAIQELSTQSQEVITQTNELLKNNPELDALSEAYNEAQKALETKRAELTSKYQADMKTAQTNLQNIREELAVANAREDKKAFSDNATGVAIVDYAAQFEGYSESNGKADIFMQPYGLTSSTPWCAGFVEYILRNSGSYDDIPEWYKNVENKLYCPTIYQDAQNAKAVVEEEDTQQGDLIIYLNEGGKAKHIGIVESIEQNSNGEWVVTTIEGNSGNAVTKHELVYKDRSDLRFLKVT
jgi:cell wall-associated NlpC family hydrolase